MRLISFLSLADAVLKKNVEDLLEGQREVVLNGVLSDTKSGLTDLEALYLYPLEVVSHRWNHLGDAGARVLCNALKRADSRIHTIQLYGNGLTHIGAGFFGEAIATNSSVRDLSLYGNRIEDEGCSAIARGLVYNSTLTSISLGRNSISSVSLITLAAALATNSTLLELDLTCNTLDEAAGSALGDLLAQSVSLEILKVRETCLTASALIGFQEGLQLSSTIKEIELSRNPLGDEGALVLAEGLTDHPSLEVLALDWCEMNDDGALAIAESAASCLSLWSLNLTSNLIDDFEGILSHCYESCSLKEIMMDYQVHREQWVAPDVYSDEEDTDYYTESSDEDSFDSNESVESRSSSVESQSEDDVESEDDESDGSAILESSRDDSTEDIQVVVEEGKTSDQSLLECFDRAESYEDEPDRGEYDHERDVMRNKIFTLDGGEDMQYAKEEPLIVEMKPAYTIAPLTEEERMVATAERRRLLDEAELESDDDP